MQGALPAQGEVTQKTLLSSSVRSEERREGGFIRLERSHKGGTLALVLHRARKQAEGDFTRPE